MEQFECARCHVAAPVEQAPLSKHCVRCHQAIRDGSFEAPADVLESWRRNLVSMRHVPSLDGVGHMLRESWIAAYLQQPHDVRPHLPSMMPRMKIDAAQASDIAAYLTKLSCGPYPECDTADVELGDAAAGQVAYIDSGCASCHRYTGAAVPQLNIDPQHASAAQALAPDLRYARQRLRASSLVGWLLEPRYVRPDAHMPRTPMTRDMARDVAAFVMNAPLEEPAKASTPVALPLLARPVTYDEIEERVFRKVCWHCHAQPDYARGDGGPGMSGGFGFAARELDLSSYEAVMSGYLDDEGELRSVFAPNEDGTPMLLAVLLERQREHVGATAELRGMPLGLPPLSAEEIQLVATWIDQGRPR
jgi:cytochrome c1